jgi:hypothetical protein
MKLNHLKARSDIDNMKERKKQEARSKKQEARKKK